MAFELSPRPGQDRTGRIVAALLALAVVSACRDEEAKARERLVGSYERVLDGRPQTTFYARQLLTVTPDGRWKRTTEIEAPGMPTESPPDSGTYRIQGVTLVMRSLVEPGGVPYRYTISGDTLFNANATEVQRVTGYDIGEETYTRVR